MARILVIDDDANFSRAMETFLRKAGYDTLVALSGTEGLELARVGKPDLVILDVMMPDMDGFQVCRHLRELAETAHIPILMFSARTRVNDKLDGFEAGADDYLTKPAHLAEVAARIRALLRRAGHAV